MSRNQRGFATIIVSIVVSVIITLITLGYASAMNRQQRQALNQVLNAQAYYASESGVNDVLARIVVEPVMASQLTCGDSKLIPDNEGRDTGASVQCTNINTAPPFLYYQSVPTDSSRARYLQIRGKSGITKLRISWNPSNNANVTSLPNPDTIRPPYYNISSWPSNVGVLRMVMIPFVPGNNRQNMIEATSHYHLFPTNTTSASSISQDNARSTSAGGPAILNASCTTSSISTVNSPLPCNVVITNIPTSGEFVIAITSLYRANNVAVETFSASDTLAPIENVQILVDVTARGTDVLRRLNVRIPYRETVSPRPFPAIEASDGICKLFTYSSAGSTDSCNI